MPSRLLTHIMEQIEDLDTDAFGKFYLYGALLNAIHETSTTPDCIYQILTHTINGSIKN